MGQTTKTASSVNGPREQIIIPGRRFGRLTIASEVERDSHRHLRFRCECDCGGEKTITKVALLRGWTRSCGCLRKETSAQNRQRAGDLATSPRCTCTGARDHNARMCRQCWKRWMRFRITPEDFFGLLDKQGGLCGVCAKPMIPGKQTHLDHCHATNKIRGIVCENCNFVLGHAKDDPLTLTSAADYLCANS